MTDVALVVAKAPMRGRGKTRLVPPLAQPEADELQRALLLDTVDACLAEGVETRLLCGSAEDARVLAELVPEVECVVQTGSGLADALRHGARVGLASGSVALVSSDLPGLPAGALGRAFAELEEGADVVLGPALDGGYWLLGLSRFRPELFEAIPWSTPAVLAATLDRCRMAGLRSVLLEPWRDVDTAADVAALATDPPERAQRSAPLLARLAAAHELPDDAPRLLRSALLWSTPWRSAVRDRLVRGGREYDYAYFAVPRAVFVVPVTSDGDLLLVRQYRHPVRESTLEVPAGSTRDGESAAEAALRELREEVGGRPAELVHLTTFYSSSAHLSLRSDAFLARDVEVEEPALDEDEEMTLVRMPFQRAVERARSGGFAEGQTALAILLAAEHVHAAGRGDVNGS